MQEHHLAVGMTVDDAVGYTIGKLHAYNPHSSYLTVRTGGLFHGTDRYSPMDAVDHSGATGASPFCATVPGETSPSGSPRTT